jgi:hypothetical protein
MSATAASRCWSPQCLPAGDKREGRGGGLARRYAHGFRTGTVLAVAQESGMPVRGGLQCLGEGLGRRLVAFADFAD